MDAERRAVRLQHVDDGGCARQGGHLAVRYVEVRRRGIGRQQQGDRRAATALGQASSPTASRGFRWRRWARWSPTRWSSRWPRRPGFPAAGVREPRTAADAPRRVDLSRDRRPRQALADAAAALGKAERVVGFSGPDRGTVQRGEGCGGAALRGGGRTTSGRGAGGWLRLHEKDGRRHDVPAHHRAAATLDEYLEVTEFARARRRCSSRAWTGQGAG